MQTLEEKRINIQACKLRLREKRKSLGMCTDCGKHPPINPLLKNSICLVCLEERKVMYYRSIEHFRDYNKKRRQGFRQRCLDHYGNKCACCGEEEDAFLTFDHINNDGAEHRRKDPETRGQICPWLEKHGYPEGFQILCWNCQWGKQKLGRCPHQIRSASRVG